MKDQVSLHGSAVDEDSAGEFYCAGLIFSLKLSGFMGKPIKLLWLASAGIYCP